MHELGERAPLHEKARAENMIQEIRQLVKNQSTDMARLRQLSSDLQQLAAGLADTGYAQETPGPLAVGVGMARNGVVPLMM